MGEQEAAQKPAGGPPEEKKPSSLRARVDRVRKAHGKKSNFVRIVVVLVILGVVGLVAWLIISSRG